jgi:hypothetical protein
MRRFPPWWLNRNKEAVEVMALSKGLPAKKPEALPIIRMGRD